MEDISKSIQVISVLEGEKRKNGEEKICEEIWNVYEIEESRRKNILFIYIIVKFKDIKNREKILEIFKGIRIN